MAARRHLGCLAKRLAPQAEAGCGPSTSGRAHCSEWAKSGGRRWFSAQQQGLGPAAAAVAAAEAAVVGGGAVAGARGPPGGLRRLRHLLRDYKQLCKMRLSMLVVSTAAAGYAAGSKERVDWAGTGWTSLGTFLCASSANALNQVYEVANDARMRRTAARPLPGGRMSRAHALAFAALTGVGGVALLADKTNTTTAALGAGNIALYAAAYTPLKQLSVVNTWVGALVGAVPPLMGWAAAAGELDAGAAILAAGLYFWQMPHFMALAWLCRADYAAGGYRMLSLVDPTGRRTAACALRNTAYLFPLGPLAAWLGLTSPYFAYESAFITAGMLLTAATFYASPSNANARLLFRASLLHLPIFMAAFILHRQPNLNADKPALLAHNARLLGFGRPFEEHELPAAAPPPGPQQRAGALAAAHRISIPPLPFLPVPRLELPACPSKAACQQAEEGGAAEEDEDEAAAAAAAVAVERGTATVVAGT